MIAPIFLGSGSRVARLVAQCWGGTGRIGANPLRIGRSGTTDLEWDMAKPAPPLPGAPHPVMICFAGVVPRSGADLGQNRSLALAAWQAARDWGVRQVFVCSSAAVYGDPGPDPVPEIADPHPLAPYGEAKLEMERALRDLPADGPRVSVLRLGNVAWAGQPFDAAQETDRNSLPLHRFEDGFGPSRSYIGPRTLAQILARLCDLAVEGAPLPHLLNIAAPRPTPMSEILDALGRKWHWTPAPDSAIQHVHLDVTRLAGLCDLPDDAGQARTLVDELPRSFQTP
ncbi:NAD-dependent epimerase/dehydratase family protein [Oceaniglobus trochenteri]|uniref:NAD-dependent epimerase/dehydratase family protein n=1 Tax=Oceaniglobus trochenteri TaxID=2763260 RepID=UPI001CFFFEF5|nr:NAD-dependent epimerase/dehydratase family protein [Oceaniglobus trochenteri]